MAQEITLILKTSHVLPAMIRKFHDAKYNDDTVTLWGSGSPMREFLHVDDLADAVRYVMEYEDELEYDLNKRGKLGGSDDKGTC